MPDESDKTASFRRDELRLPALVKTVPCLVVVEGSGMGGEVRLDRPNMVIGRAEDAAITVDDRLVSREHARVVAEASEEGVEYFLEDNASTNGTFLNNQQVRRAPLREGDKIRVGSTVLRFSYHDEVDAEYHRQIYELITYDELTGLLTLRSFYRELEREILRVRRSGLSLALLMMDVDHFKLVNDTYGHQAGSYVLKQIGLLIRQSLRYNDSAARYGGEEFIAYLPRCGPEEAMAGAERVRLAIEGFPFAHGGEELRVTISIGVAQAPGDGTDVETLVRRADQALYRAKDAGRNRVLVFQESEAPEAR